MPDGAGAEEEADNHEDDADTSLSSSAPSTASLPMRATMTRPTDGEDGEQQQQQPQPAVKPEAVVLEALATLDALSRKLGGAIRLHAQPAFKPPVPLTAEGPWSASSSPSSPSSYPAGAAPIGRRSATAVLEGSSTGAVGEEEALALSLSLEGFAFLAIDSLLALLHLPHTAPGAARPASAAAAAAARAIPTRALVVIHTLLPYLSPPAPTSAHGQRLLALLSSLAPALAAPAAGPGAMGDALPLLALRLLELLPAGSELPGLALEIPEPVAALALAAAAHWPARFAPLVRALQGGPGAARAGAEDGEGVMAGIEAARRLVARAKPVLSLLLAATQGEVVPAREEEDRQERYVRAMLA